MIINLIHKILRSPLTPIINKTDMTLITGFRKGFYVRYRSATAVSIESGIIEANSKLYSLSVDTNHPMTSLALGFDFHYIYIDNSASLSPNAVVIDSTTEPIFSDTKQGWYNGDDKCIGVLHSPAGSAIIARFSSISISSNSIRVFSNTFPTMASFMSVGTGAYQTPNGVDGSVVTPVNAKEIYLSFFVQDLNSQCSGYCSNSEYATDVPSTILANFSETGFNTINLLFWIPLENSRNVMMAGDADDDNNMFLSAVGYEYSI